MENYIVSARKYRPMTFDTVVGQSALTTTLKNAIKNNKLAHAYLFCGSRGVGKTTCARIFAKTINCFNPNENVEACNECESCKAFNEQRSFNIHELDAASNNSVDDIRQLIEQVRIPPQVGKYKVFIIDEVHMLSPAAFNAFLKTLEEPPHHAIFILATTEKHKLLPTILSRCQIYDFNRMKVDDIVAHLASVAAKEGITSEPAALNVIAQKADGGMRDALSIFDQVASFCGGNITYQRTIETLNVLDYDYYFKFVDYFLENKVTECMLTYNEILSKGFEGQHFINGLASHLRNLLVSRDEQTIKLIEASDDIRNRYHEQAMKCQIKFLYGAIKLCTDCDLNYKQSNNKRLLVELTLIQLDQLAQGEDVPGSGRSPRKILAPLFKQINSANAAVKPAALSSAYAAHTTNNTMEHVATQSAQVTGLEARMGANTVIPPVNSSNSNTIRLKGFSISNAGKTPERQPVIRQPKVQVVTEIHPQVRENVPIDKTNLLIAFKEFAELLPQEEVAMAVRFNAIEPTILEDNSTFEIIADNPNLEIQLNKYVPRVEQFMRKRMANQNIKMLVRLREEEDKKRAFNKYEQFQLMCEQNDALNHLKEMLQLEIG